MTAIGRTVWAIPGGRIPLDSTGVEPAFTSRDELSILNTGNDAARITLTVYYPDRNPVRGYEITVEAERVRRVRCNDLIDPEALPLDVDYGVLIESNLPVVIQFSRVDTSQDALAITMGFAFAVDA